MNSRPLNISEAEVDPELLPDDNDLLDDEVYHDAEVHDIIRETEESIYHEQIMPE